MNRLFAIVLMIMIFQTGFSQCKEKLPLWLEGLWEIQGSIETYEEWTYHDNNQLKGYTFKKFENTRLVLDSMLVKCIDRLVVMEVNAMVKQLKVRAGFIQNYDNDKMWTYTNSITDFPSELTYIQIDNDTLNIWIKGKGDNPNCMEATLVRVK